MDPIVAGYVYLQPHRFLLYAFMASAGSALGSLLIYVVGYEMGELVLEKRIGKTRFDRIRRRFEAHEFLALMLPAMMPPPFPFKAFALSAAVFEMHFGHFLLAIFAGRMGRFLILSLLVIKFGPRAVSLAGDLIRAHLNWPMLALAAVALVLLFWFLFKKKNNVAAE